MSFRLCQLQAIGDFGDPYLLAVAPLAFLRVLSLFQKAPRKF